MSFRVARLDPSLRATVVSRRALRYRLGAESAVDRPAHVRAGSSMAWFGDRLVLVQDDANFIALVDPLTGSADAVTLPAGEGGLRQFDDARGNKRFKLDLEACCAIETADGPRVIAFGSGSTALRRSVAILEGESSPRASLVAADTLYRALESAGDFAGSEMNIEGALALPGAIRLFGRGNGAARDGREPVNATCELSIAALLSYLAAPAASPPPIPSSITQFQLGVLDGLSLGFTDAAVCSGAVLYTAAGEASVSAAEDGRVTGSVIGVIPMVGDLRYARLMSPDGDPLSDKVEGIAPIRESADRVFVVVDADDATASSELCEVRLEGPWR